MKSAVGVGEVVSGVESKQEQRARLAEYVAQQPASKQSFHKWMRILEVLSLVLAAGAFIAAIVISTNRTGLPTTAIAFAWFAFAGSASLVMLLMGLHSVILGAYPAIILPGKTQKFVTGRAALGPGVGLIVGAVVALAFWGVAAYIVWSGDLALLKPLISALGILVGVAIVVSIVASIYRSFTRSR